MSSGIGWAESLTIGNVKAGPGVRQAAIGLMMTSLTQAMRTDMTMIHEKHQRRNHADVADDPRWARIVARDRTADGHLWYSVVTTGVYCRPSCPSRSANPKNVQLHDTVEEAMATGFRPCKRCNPNGLSVEAENVAIVARACRLIEESEDEPSLTDLAAAVGRSPSYFHRRFKGGDIRRRLQFQRSLLREIHRHARHDAVPISRRWCQRGNSFCCG